MNPITCRVDLGLPIQSKLVQEFRPGHKLANFCVNSDFRLEVADRTTVFWVVTQRVVVIYYRRFGTSQSCL